MSRAARFLHILLLCPLLSGCCIVQAIGAGLGHGLRVAFLSSDAIDVDIPNLHSHEGCPKVFPPSAAAEAFILMVENCTVEGIRNQAGAMDLIVFGRFRVPPEELVGHWLSSIHGPMR